MLEVLPVPFQLLRNSIQAVFAGDIEFYCIEHLFFCQLTGSVGSSCNSWRAHSNVIHIVTYTEEVIEPIEYITGSDEFVNVIAGFSRQEILHAPEVAATTGVHSALHATRTAIVSSYYQQPIAKLIIQLVREFGGCYCRLIEVFFFRPLLPTLSPNMRAVPDINCQAPTAPTREASLVLKAGFNYGEILHFPGIPCSLKIFSTITK